MAKKTKSLNPADAFRKAQRQKEIKRNKLDRKKAREGAQNKKDSSVIQAEISQLERLSKRTLSEENRLNDLRNELSLIFKAKEQKGAASSNDRSGSKVIIDPATGLPAPSDPECRNHTEQNTHNASASKPSNSVVNFRTMNWFGPDGKLLEPERSFYYDPVFNPFGVPPPGMPVRMKVTSDLSLHAHTSNLDHPVEDHGNGQSGIQEATSPLREVDGVSEKQENFNHASDESQSEEEEGTENAEDDITLPEGSPPRDQSEDDTDDDISLPDGPPPPQPVPQSRLQDFINRPPQHVTTHPRSQTSLPHPSFTQSQPYFPPPITLVPGIPPPPVIAGLGAMPFPLGPNGLPLPPPPINKFHSLPPPPPSAKLPAKPDITAPHKATVAPNPKPMTQASATVTALPQLRDLKREATSFVPAAIRKKRKELDRRAGLAGLGDSNRIQAAPEAFDDSDNNQSFLDSESQEASHSKQPKQVTTSLLAALKRDGVVSNAPVSKASMGFASAEKDDYDKFVESLGDVL